MVPLAPLFSKALFKQNLRRFWPLLAVYLFIVAIFAFTYAMQLSYFTNLNAQEFIRNIFNASATLSLAIAFFAIATAVAVFSYIHNATATSMTNALPYKRRTVFISNYISGLFMLLIPLVILFLALIGIGVNYNVLDIMVLMKWLFIFSSYSFILYSLAVVLGMLTGSIIAHIAFFGIANFLLIGLEALINLYLGRFLYGFTGINSLSNAMMEKATPIVHIASINYYNGSLNTTMSLWLIYIFVGLLFTCLGLKLYQNRKMEHTGDVIAIRKLNPIFKYGVTFCSSLALGLMLTDMFNAGHSFFWTVILLLIAGAIGYFVAEMLLRKSYRVFGLYKGLVVYALLLTLLSVSIYNDWYGYASRVPDISKVQVVAFSNNGLGYRTVDNLQAENSRVYLDEISNLPESLALTYGEPIDKVDNYGGGYRYIYNDTMNLTKDETQLLWSLIPGIFMEEATINDIHQLHTYLAQNVKQVRNNYRSRDTSKWYANESHPVNHYYIKIIYKLNNGKISEHTFPVLMPHQITNELDKSIYNQLASIAGSPERRAQKIAAIDMKADNIRHIYLEKSIDRYSKEFPVAMEEVTIVVPKEDGGDIKIAPEDYPDFIKAFQADYLSMTNEEMLRLNYNNWGYASITVDNLNLSPNNKYRERHLNLDIDFYHKNVQAFLYDKGYINTEMYDFIQEYSKIVETSEKPSPKISLAAL